MVAANQSLIPALTAPVRHRFLSPHYDDVALSCGGSVALLARTGTIPEIRVAFGAEPDPDQQLSALANVLHRYWGFDAAQVVRERRREEATAVALLGATSTSMSLCDAIYRGQWYQNANQLLGTVATAEAALPNQITAELRDATDLQATTRFYVPLGVGNHVDHQLSFAAGLDLVASGWDVWFYEDLPYALTARALDRRLDQIAASWEAVAPAALQDGFMEPVARIDITEVWETKLAAILAYASQLSSVFHLQQPLLRRLRGKLAYASRVPAIIRHVAPDASMPRIEAALRDYASRHGDGLLVEQMWQVRPAEPGRQHAGEPGGRNYGIDEPQESESSLSGDTQRTNGNQVLTRSPLSENWRGLQHG